MHSQILKMPNVLRVCWEILNWDTPKTLPLLQAPSCNGAFLPVDFILPWISAQSIQEIDLLSNTHTGGQIQKGKESFSIRT